MAHLVSLLETIETNGVMAGSQVRELSCCERYSAEIGCTAVGTSIARTCWRIGKRSRCVKILSGATSHRQLEKMYNTVALRENIYSEGLVDCRWNAEKDNQRT